RRAVEAGIGKQRVKRAVFLRVERLPHEIFVRWTLECDACGDRSSALRHVALKHERLELRIDRTPLGGMQFDLVRFQKDRRTGSFNGGADPPFTKPERLENERRSVLMRHRLPPLELRAAG